MRNLESSAPGSAERIGIPKVEVSFDPPLKILQETDPQALAEIEELGTALKQALGLSLVPSDSTLQPGEEDDRGTLLSGVEVRVDGGMVFVTPKVLVPVVEGNPRHYQWPSYHSLSVREGRLVVPSGRSSDVVLALLIERANENPEVQALLSSL